ncbi:hypothetical protein ADUPG1_003924, partial [Aduncisulcus paluster]
MSTNGNSVLLAAPFLKKFDRKSWFLFHREFAVYKARGGQASWITLIEPCLLETLFLTAGISDTSEGFEAGELKKLLDQKFGSTSTQAFFDELDKLSLSVLDQSKLIYYIARFKGTVQLNPDFGDGESLVKRFIAGIKIPRLADRVSSEAKTAGKKDDLTFVMKQALTEIDDMIAIRDEVKAHPESFGIRSGPELGKRRSLHSKDGHQNK